MQSKWGSVLETMVGTLVGFLISWLINYEVLPLYGFKINTQDNFEITVIFTAVSLLRSYGVRRLFNWLHMRKESTTQIQMTPWGVRSLGEKAARECDAVCAKAIHESLMRKDK